jgi:hypothetical protein
VRPALLEQPGTIVRLIRVAVVSTFCLDRTPGKMSKRPFKVGDQVRFKTEWPPRIATVSEILEGGWLVLEWQGPPPSTTSCDSQDVELAREAPPPRKKY